MRAFDAPVPFGVRVNKLGPEYTHVTDANGNEVATVWNVPYDGGKQALALAQLFSAAPDLLAACEALLACQSDDCWCDDDGDDYMSGGCAACQARAVIAKAKGGAK